MKKISAKIYLLLFILIVFSLPQTKASAAEINPDPSTYSYGSTSEYSESKQVQITSGQLANTGQDYRLVTLIAVLGTICSLTLIYNKRLRRYRKSKL